MKLRAYISPDDWSYNALAVLALLLPLQKRAAAVMIALVVLVSIVKKLGGKKQPFNWNALPMALLAGLYVVILLSYFLSAESADAGMALEIKASFLVFPLLFFLLPEMKKGGLHKLYDAFQAGCLLFLIFSIGFGIYRAFHFHSIQFLAYEKLSVVFHPGYMAMFQCMSLVWLVKRAVNQDFWFARRSAHVSFMVLTVVYIAMLASKAGILSAVLVLGVMTWMERRNGLRLKATGFYTAAMLSILLITSFALPRTSQRLSSLTSEMRTTEVQATAEEPKKSKGSTALRKLTWSVAAEVWWEHPFGVGAGEMANSMVAKYEERGETYAAERRLPAHNQFLQTGAELGWPGFLLLIFFLVVLSREILRRCEVFSVAFLALIWFNFLFESCLEAQAGIVWFCFWSGVFLSNRNALVAVDAPKA